MPPEHWSVAYAQTQSVHEKPSKPDNVCRMPRSWHHSDEPQLWTGRTVTKFKSVSLGTWVLGCSAHGRENWLFTMSTGQKLKNPWGLGQPVGCSSLLCMWSSAYQFLKLQWELKPCRYFPCSVFRLETRRFAGSLSSATEIILDLIL